MPFPVRVNLVYGSRWGLAKKGWGDCPVEAASVQELAVAFQYRRSCDFRWIMVERDDSIRMVCIRNDHHPQRFLRAGIPVTLQAPTINNWNVTDNHLWVLEYPGGCARPDCEFHVRSKQSGMYLVITDKGGTGVVTLQKQQPAEVWRAYDATRQYTTPAADGMPHSLPDALAAARTKIAGAPAVDLEAANAAPRQMQRLSAFLGETVPSIPVPDSSSVMQIPKAAALSRPSLARSPTTEWAKEKRLTCFDGDAFATFKAIPETESPKRSEFKPLDELLRDGIELCNDVDFLPGPVGQQLGVEYLFPAFVGQSSDFMRRFHERRRDQDLKVNLVSPDELGVPFASVATVRCTVSVPVLGSKPYYEAQRYVLCKRCAGDNEKVFVSQQVGSIDGGRLAGIIKTETVDFFSQRPGGRILFRRVADKPKSLFAKQAIEGYHKALEDFHETAKDLLLELDFPVPPAIESPSKNRGSLVNLITDGLISTVSRSRGQSRVSEISMSRFGSCKSEDSTLLPAPERVKPQWCLAGCFAGLQPRLGGKRKST